MQDIDAALGWLQKNIGRFGGDPTNMHLFGHSAGAHLVSMTAVRPLKNAHHLLASGAIRSVISNDTRAYDIAQIAATSPRGQLPKLYQRAFGSDPAVWRGLSPTHYVKYRRKYPAFLLLYSGQGRASLRADSATNFAAHLKRSDTPIQLFDGRHYSHTEINKKIGTAADLTHAINDFLNLYR